MATEFKQVIKSGDIVKVEYIGKLNDGTVFDSSKGRKPLSFKVGSGTVISGFDKAVDGMRLNQEKKFIIPCDQAYGPIKTEMMIEIPKNKLPKSPEPKVGMMLGLKSPEGHQMPARIAKVSDDKVTIDIREF